MKTIRLADGREITYELTRKPVKNINFRAKPGNIVAVSASPRISIDEIEKALMQHAEFFFSAFQRVDSHVRPLFGTESIRWLGKNYPVRVIESSRECAVIEETECRVFTRSREDANVSELIKRTVVQRFAELCGELNAEVRNSLQKRGLTPPPARITIKDMKSRWGSCSYNNGHISINIRLCEYPRETVLSVFWHEYAHFWHHDHSKRFYDFLENMYPEYRVHNDLLKKSEI